jgi:hypothetical protein
MPTRIRYKPDRHAPIARRRCAKERPTKAVNVLFEGDQAQLRDVHPAAEVAAELAGALMGIELGTGLEEAKPTLETLRQTYGRTVGRWTREAHSVETDLVD